MPTEPNTRANAETRTEPLRPACPVCGGRLVEIRGKLHCEQCRTICETCCEGGRSG